MLNIIYNIDARRIAETIPNDVKVQTTITSPPYFDMKDYGCENQVGFGQTYEQYLHDLQDIFGQVLSVTKENGTLWIIIDTFKRNNQVIPLPFDLSNKLNEIGWYLQEIIIWKKDKTVPWSTNGFMQRKFEYILFFSKTPDYKYNKDKVRIFDTQLLKKWWVKYPERYNPKGKALDEIWEFPIPVQGSWGDKYIRHFCPLPKEMVATMIEISSQENDIVLDPFAGTGTVLSQSAYMHRAYLGFELNPSYIDQFNSYLQETLETGKLEYKDLKNGTSQNEFENQILDLRALKFGRLLLNSIEKEFNRNNLKIFVQRNGQSDKSHKTIIVQYTILGIEETSSVDTFIAKQVSIPPLSKFGVESSFKFKELMIFDGQDFYGYTKTNSYSYEKTADIASAKIKVVSNIKVDLNEKDYE